MNVNGSSEFVLYNDFNYNEISKGDLSSFFFIFSVKIIAEYKILNKIFDKKQISQNGCNDFIIYIQGKPTIISIDASFPCYSNKLFYCSHTNNSEIWLHVMEKIWAKVNYSYASSAVNGLPPEIFNIFSEAPCIEYLHTNSNSSISILWGNLLEAKLRDYVIFASPEPVGNKEDIEQYGLYSSFLYQIYDIKVELNEQILILKNKCGIMSESKLNSIIY